ncbi:hypothetical protein DRN73_03975 [Candidatus Pacearchaeota archaeon]|nr:MAG: hypothetical protein DRN73_03975 [Candidatus Pacearchaeota archaeon]
MKKRIKSILFLFIILFLIGNISASFAKGNKSHQIDSVYGANENIRGWINISFANEALNSLFTDSKGNSITLIDLLQSDSRLSNITDYTCNPIGCKLNYQASNVEETKNFELNAGEEKLLGFKFTGIIDSINDVSFNITSDAESSCSNQLKIDFFNNGIFELGNNKTTDEACSNLKRQGCFESQSSYDYSVLSNNGKYCQEINLTESPGFKLGAWINLKNNPGVITLGIYDTDDLSNELASCDILETSGTGFFNCSVNFSVIKSKPYYICIYSDKENEDSEIRGYSTNNGCGFYDDGSWGWDGSMPSAFNIFAIGKKFDSVGEISINDNSISEDYLISDYFIEYIDKITDNTDNCTKYSCIIPLKIKSEKNQNITVKNISVKYSQNGIKNKKDIYDLSVSPALITSNGSIKIYLDNANLTLPSLTGASLYSLFFKNNKIFSENITIKPSPKITSLSPLDTASKFPVEFRVYVVPVENTSISSYEWQFGDAQPVTTSTGKISHSFDSAGNYPVKVTVYDSNGSSSSKTFNINVFPYTSVLEKKINESKTNLNNITNYLQQFSQFERDSINQIINFSSLNAGLTEAETLYSQADYESSVVKLVSLNIPESITKGISTDLVSFYPKKENINLNAITSDYNSSDTEKYINAISNFESSNLNIKVKYSKININYPGGISEPLINIFELSISKKNTLNYSIYVYINALDNIRFQGNISMNNSYAKIEIPSDESSKTIKFSTTQDINFLDLPVFISPDLDDLVIITPENKKGMKWALFILIMIFLLIVGFIAYIILQQWYKTKYETYLFKNKNYLYNLINYIQNSKKKGIKDAEIIKNLKKAGWNSEQITYVIKKYMGKRTGMFEIPVEKVLNKFKKNKTPVFKKNPQITSPMTRPKNLMTRPVIKKNVLSNQRNRTFFKNNK